MPQRLAGMVVSSSEVDLVILDVEAGHFDLISQSPVKVPVGDRAQAYRVVYEHLQDQLRESGVECACIKASAVSLGGTKKVHLEAAELRGVALAAAAAVCEVRSVSKALTSRTFGNRGVDEYLKDNAFWNGIGLVGLKKGVREAAFTAISQFA